MGGSGAGDDLCGGWLAGCWEGLKRPAGPRAGAKSGATRSLLGATPSRSESIPGRFRVDEASWLAGRANVFALGSR